MVGHASWCMEATGCCQPLTRVNSTAVLNCQGAAVVAADAKGRPCCMALILAGCGCGHPQGPAQPARDHPAVTPDASGRRRQHREGAQGAVGDGKTCDAEQNHHVWHHRIPSGSHRADSVLQAAVTGKAGHDCHPPRPCGHCTAVLSRTLIPCVGWDRRINTHTTLNSQHPSLTLRNFDQEQWQNDVNLMPSVIAACTRR